jgi:hypothetical protein
MLIEFDQSTIANMTAALEHVCKNIPRQKDNHETRKLIADAMMASARTGRRSLISFQKVGREVLAEIARPKKVRWFRLRGKRSRTS